jgi:hypothetical protein
MCYGLEGSKGGREEDGRKWGIVEHTVVPNVALWNIGFQWIRIVLLNVFAYKESSTPEFCILICELRCINPLFFSIRIEGYNTLQGTATNLQQCSSAADATVTRLLNRLSFCCLSADLLSADWSLTENRTQLSHQFYWKTNQPPKKLTKGGVLCKSKTFVPY